MKKEAREIVLILQWERKMEKVSWKKICTLVIGSVVLYWLLNHFGVVTGAIGALLSLFSPFILGGAIAFIINVPMSAIERKLKLKKNKRAAAYGITLVLLVAVITFCAFVIVPQVVETIELIAKQVPVAVASAQKLIEDIPFPELQKIVSQWEIDWGSITQKAVNLLQSSATGLINSGINIISSIISGVTSFVIGFVFSVYVLLQKERLTKQMHQILFAFLPKERAQKVERIGSLTHRTFSKFISGQVLEALILGGMFFVVMVVVQLPYPLVISILITLTALIPIVGAFIGCAIGALLIVMVSPLQALIFIILFLILQQIEGNLIYPHVVGNSVGLPSIWVLVAVTIGGNLMGIVGMLIFIPICSVAYVLFKEIVEKRLSVRKEKESEEA